MGAESHFLDAAERTNAGGLMKENYKLCCFKILKLRNSIKGAKVSVV